MKKSKKISAWAAVLLACLALTGGGWYLMERKKHPDIQIASPFPQLETAQKQKPFRLQYLTQIGYPSHTFELALKQGENKIRARTVYSPEGWAAYYRCLSLGPGLSLGRYAGPFFAESEFQDYILLEPADPKAASVSSLTYREGERLITAAAPYRYLVPIEDPAQGWIAFSETLSPEQALALLEEQVPLDWETPLHWD